MICDEKKVVEPKVSVIIPICNVVDYVEQCLLSVKEQTLADIEVICVDDASEDESYKVAIKCVQGDGRFTFFRMNQNKGQSYVRNYGMEKAKGKYLYFLDSDDYLDKYALEKLYNYAEMLNLQGICFGSKMEYENTTIPTQTIMYSNCETLTSGKDFLIDVSKRGEFQVAVWSQFWLRQYIEEHKFRFYEGIVYEDTLYTLQVLLNAQRVMSIKDVLYHYRKREGSTTTKWGKNQLRSYMIVYYQVLKLWLEYKNKNEIEEAMKERLNVFHRRINVAIGQLGYIPKLQFEDSVCQYLYSIITRTLPEYQYVIAMNQELREYLAEQDYIFVYGAGIIADETIRLLEENRIKIEGIVVTNKKNENEMFKGYHVYNLEEIRKEQGKVLILLALSSKYHPEVKDRIEYAGYTWCDRLLK